MHRNHVTAGALAAVLAAGGLSAGASVESQRVLKVEARGGSPQLPGDRAPGLMELLQALSGGAPTGRVRVAYIRRPFGSVARDKRAAAKRRGVARHRQAMRR